MDESRRIKVHVNGFQHQKKCWLLIDFSRLKYVKDLRAVICDQLAISTQGVQLFMDDFLLPKDECAKIVRDGDMITVSIRDESKYQSSPVITPSCKKRRHEVETEEIVQPKLPKIKKKQRISPATSTPVQHDMQIASKKASHSVNAGSTQRNGKPKKNVVPESSNDENSEPDVAVHENVGKEAVSKNEENSKEDTSSDEDAENDCVPPIQRNGKEEFDEILKFSDKFPLPKPQKRRRVRPRRKRTKKSKILSTGKVLAKRVLGHQKDTSKAMSKSKQINSKQTNRSIIMTNPSESEWNCCTNSNVKANTSPFDAQKQVSNVEETPPSRAASTENASPIADITQGNDAVEKEKSSPSMRQTPQSSSGAEDGSATSKSGSSPNLGNNSTCSLGNSENIVETLSTKDLKKRCKEVQMYAKALQIESAEKTAEQERMEQIGYENLEPLKRPLQSADQIAFKVVELDEKYCPHLSDYKVGEVVCIDEVTKDVQIKIIKQKIVKRSARFHMDVEGEDENLVTWPMYDIKDAKLVTDKINSNNSEEEEKETSGNEDMVKVFVLRQTQGEKRWEKSRVLL